MLIYKKERATLYKALCILTIFCIISIPVTWYLTGKFPSQAIGGIAIAASAILGVVNKFNNYIALSDDHLIISTHTDPSLSNDIYVLNQISKVEFRRESWLSGANYQIAITKNIKSPTIVKTIGLVGVSEVCDLCKELQRRDINAFVVGEKR